MIVLRKVNGFREKKGRFDGAVLFSFFLYYGCLRKAFSVLRRLKCLHFFILAGIIIFRTRKKTRGAALWITQ